MSIIKRRKKIIKELKNKEYRDAFVSEHINTGIPFQIRALREQRGWNQEELGTQVGDMAQESISRLEDPNYAKFTLTTLKRLASAFDIALMVRFVPFSELVEWDINLSPESLEVASFNQESYFQEKLEEISDFTLIDQNIMFGSFTITAEDTRMFYTDISSPNIEIPLELTSVDSDNIARNVFDITQYKERKKRKVA